MTAHRLPLLDVARGVAIVAMAAYHFTWDLAFHRLITVDLFEDPLWLAARTGILGSFLMLAGFSLVLAGEGGLDRRRYLRRLGTLVVAAAGVTAVSLWVFPDSPIFFGVLHHMAVASVLGLAVLRLPWPVTLGLGVAAWVAGDTVALPLFDHPWLQWVGLMTYAPDSNDYVPLLPWFGLFLAGMAAAQAWRDRAMLARPAGALRPLAWAGRHSLIIYLIHQPLLFGGVSLIAPPAGLGGNGDFLPSCIATCRSGGTAREVCERSCGCVLEGWTREGILDDLAKSRITPDDARVARVIQRCM